MSIKPGMTARPFRSIFSGVRSGEPADVLIRAGGYDAVASDRDRLRNGKPVVDRDDLPVRKNQIRRGLLRTQRRKGEHQVCGRPCV